MEFFERFEFEAFIASIECNSHESQIIKELFDHHDHPAEALLKARNIVRSEVARRIDAFAYTYGINLYR